MRTRCLRHEARIRLDTMLLPSRAGERGGRADLLSKPRTCDTVDFRKAHSRERRERARQSGGLQRRAAEQRPEHRRELLRGDAAERSGDELLRVGHLP